MEKIPVTTIHAETISLASLGNDTAKKIEEAVRTSPVEARPIVCVPNPEWLLGRLSKSLRAGVLLKGVAPSPGELCLLVNEVGPAGHEEAKVWGLVTLGAPVEAVSVFDLGEDLRKSVDDLSHRMAGDGPVAYFPLKLVETFDPPVDIESPPASLVKETSDCYAELPPVISVREEVYEAAAIEQWTGGED